MTIFQGDIYWIDLGEEDGIYAGSESEEESTRDPESG